MSIRPLSNGRRSLRRLQRTTIHFEIDRFLKAVAGKPADKFSGHDHEVALRTAMYGAWQAKVRAVEAQLSLHIHGADIPWMPRASAEGIMSVLNSHMGPGINVAGATRDAMTGTFDLGKASVDAQFKNQTGRAPVKKDLASFGILFGLTEDHALQALTDQLTIAAGGFWDNEMSASVKKEVESFFTGKETRAELAEKLTTLVNERLSIEGAKSLPASYFDGLAEHYIVRARNVGAVYRGKSLGAKHYAIVNPNDKRTSTICRALTKPGLTFTMAGAEDRVTGILQARTASDLKVAAPFLTDGTASSESSPVPPLHWRCRSWMRFIFEGLG